MLYIYNVRFTRFVCGVSMTVHQAIKTLLLQLKCPCSINILPLSILSTITLVEAQSSISNSFQILRQIAFGCINWIRALHNRMNRKSSGFVENTCVNLASFMNVNIYKREEWVYLIWKFSQSIGFLPNLTYSPSI